ncbi:hypothetical protein [Labilibaculum sp.]|uniref:hypothetical protein n=1 Tax=Labilibaculum sp. TaxID=2060723 RepID=UPI0035691499
MTTTYRELTKIKELIEELGFFISYPFDDLLFVDSNAFLIQFNDEKANAFFLYFNQTLHTDAMENIRGRIEDLATTKKIHIAEKGLFQLQQKADSEDEIELKFIS